MMALCDDGYTLLLLAESYAPRTPGLWPSKCIYVLKYFIEPIEDEL